MTDQRKGMKKCPTELKDYIFKLAGPLTNYLNGRLDMNSNFNKRLIRRDAILMGWRGEYSKLFECSDHDIQDEISDIVINQSKDFHEWLVDHLGSRDSTTNIYNKLQYLNWDEWWKDWIEACDNNGLENHLWFAIQYNHVEMFREIMTDEMKRKRLLGEKNDRYFIDIFINLSQAQNIIAENLFLKPAQSKMLWSILQNVTHDGSKRAMDAAAIIGNIDIIKWLHINIRNSCSTDAMDWAAQNGHLEVVKWLHENRPEGCTTDAMDLAAATGHLEIVKWLHENRTEGCTEDALDWKWIKRN